jgi:nucleoside 2-deoxyribosyltransferase
LISSTKLLEKAGKNGSALSDDAGASLITVSVIGSYNKHLRQMKNLIVECKKLNIQVLIPKYAVRKFSRNRFVYLRGESGTPKQLQEKNFRFIEQSSFVLVVNPKGYIGPSTAMEIGFAIAKGIPIFCTDKPKDYVFRFYTEYNKSLNKIKELMLTSGNPVIER